MPAKRLDDEIRAFFEQALKQSQEKKPLIDVRSPGEFKGSYHMPEYPQEGVLRGGLYPGAKSFPWKRAANDLMPSPSDPPEQLKAIYDAAKRDSIPMAKLPSIAVSASVPAIPGSF